MNPHRGLFTIVAGLFAHAAWATPNWVPCASTTGSRVAECAAVDVPLDHALPQGPTLPLSVMRFPATRRERRQLWLVDGGPGDSGRASLPAVAALFKEEADLGLYTFDHRGVGGSAPLECPAQQAASSPGGAEITDAEWPDCLVHIQSSRPDLPFITVDQAAHDLSWLIERTRRPHVPVFAWGVSYGTYLLWQFLHHHGEQADGVIADGIVPPDWSFAEFDGGLDRVGRRWLSLCPADPACRAHLGANPIARYREALSSLAAGPCRAMGLTPELFKLVEGNLLMADEPLRRLVPVVAHRVGRCGAEDRAALGVLFDALFASGRIGEDPRRHNVIAERHLALSALWHDDDPTSKDLERTLQRVLLTTGVSVPLARAFPDWPRAPGPSSRSLPIYHGPLLLLHGSLDPTMPLERLAEVRRFYSDRGQTFVPVPRAGHVTLNSGACVLGLYRAFLNAPQRPLDTRCVQTAVPAVVTPSRALSMEVFGTGDVWGDGIPQCPAAGR